MMRFARERTALEVASITMVDSGAEVALPRRRLSPAVLGALSGLREAAARWERYKPSHQPA